MTPREKRLEASKTGWKAKNKARYDEIKALKMRLKETAESRDKWKMIAKEREKSLIDNEENLAEADLVLAQIKQELDNLKKNTRN
jgi:hypothetical protein